MKKPTNKAGRGKKIKDIPLAEILALPDSRHMIEGRWPFKIENFGREALIFKVYTLSQKGKK